MNGYLYYYQKSAQEDIIGLLDNNYNVVATYEYDSWGKVVSIKDVLGNEITDANNIAIINPYRYRSYYYDKETNLYYLNTRYYNPTWGRFINADGIINADKKILGYNLYAYLSNNYINYYDYSGKFALSISSGVAFLETIKGALEFIGVGLGIIGAVAVGADVIDKTDINFKIEKEEEQKPKEKKYSVYSLYDPKTTEVVYVGRTDNIDRRLLEHAKNPFRNQLQLQDRLENMSYEEARGVEQVLILKYKTLNRGNKTYNQINGINPRNPRYGMYWDAAMNYFESETYVGSGYEWK